MSARKVVNTSVTTVLCPYLLYALLKAAMSFELGILLYSTLTLRETRMDSLSSVRPFVLLVKSFLSFMYDGIFFRIGWRR